MPTPTFNGTSFIISDFNKDGKSDILSINIIPPSLQCSVRYNYSLYLFEILNPLSSSLETTFKYVDAKNTSFGLSDLGDFNGDGYVDLFHENQNLFLLYKENESNLVHGIYDGKNHAYTFEYESIGRDSEYSISTSSGYPTRDFFSPIYVVKTMTFPDGKGSTNSNTYVYEGGKLNLQGLGFLGFTSFIKSDYQNHKTKYVFDNRFTTISGINHFARVVDEIEIRQTNNNSLISKLENTYGEKYRYSNKLQYTIIRKSKSTLFFLAIFLQIINKFFIKF